MVFDCGPEGTDGRNQRVSVLDLVDGALVVLGGREGSGYRATLTATDPSGVTSEVLGVEWVLDLRIAGRVTIRWNQAIGHLGSTYGPQREVTITYDWDGSELRPGGATIVDVPPLDR